MARIRYIKPEFFEDPMMGDLSPTTRLFYIGLWCHLDRNGVVENSSRIFKSKIFAFDQNVSCKDCADMVLELCQHGLLFQFEYQGKKYLYCPGFSKQQNFHIHERPRFNIPIEFLKRLESSLFQQK